MIRKIPKLLIVECIIFTAALWNRLSRATTAPTIKDEMWTQRMIALDWEKLLFGLDPLENKHQLYYLLIKPLYYLTDSISTQRLTSVLIGMTSISIGYFFLKKAFDRNVAILWLCFMAVSPAMVAFDAYLRSYVLFSLFTVIFWWLFYRSLAINPEPRETSRGTPVSLVLVLSLSLFAHSFMFLIAAGWAVLSLTNVHITRRSRFRITIVWLLVSLAAIYRASIQTLDPKGTGLDWLDSHGRSLLEIIPEVSYWLAPSTINLGSGNIITFCIVFVICAWVMTQKPKNRCELMMRYGLLLSVLSIIGAALAFESTGKQILIFRFVVPLLPLIYMTMAIAGSRILDIARPAVPLLAALATIGGSILVQNRSYRVMANSADFPPELELLGLTESSHPVVIHPLYVHEYLWKNWTQINELNAHVVPLVHWSAPKQPPAVNVVYCNTKERVESEVPDEILEKLRTGTFQEMETHFRGCGNRCCRIEIFRK